MFGKKSSALYCAMAIFAVISFLLLYGCADRDELEETRRQQAPGYDAEANEALQRAEKAMEDAGVSINFNELNGLESLSDLRTILPDPLEIAQLEKQQKIEDAIVALYDVLGALGEPDVSGAPTRVLIPDEKSNSDIALIRVHLAYCYVLAAVSRLARVGMGPDGVPNTEDDLYRIKLEELDVEDPEVYQFMLTERGENLKADVDKNDPNGYIKMFYDEGQVNDEGNVKELQAMIDSLLLLLGAKVTTPEVVISENPKEVIKAHEPQVDRTKYRHNALYHLEIALELAEEIVPELKDALDEFDETITEYFSKGTLEDAKEWGFDIRDIPERYEYLLEE